MVKYLKTLEMIHEFMFYNIFLFVIISLQGLQMKILYMIV